MPGSTDANERARLLANYTGEREGEALYRELAGIERDPARADILRRMADIEGRHASRWEDKLRAIGVEPPSVKLNLRMRSMLWLARRWGVDAVLPLVRGMELRAAGGYSGQPDAVDFVPDEREHARTLAAMTAGRTLRTATPPARPDAAPTADRTESVAEEILGRERWHKRDTGGALRAAVFGVNDGLVSNLSLVIGVAGADPGSNFVLLAGVAGLLAGSFSMAAGEYVSISAQRELFERQIALEREELLSDPEQEQDELALLYEAKGVPAATAQEMARQIMRDPDVALDTLAREELGLDPSALGSPWTAAISSFVAFAIGAILPVLPYIFANGNTAFILSAVFSALGLATVGALLTLFTGRSPLFGAARMLGIGALAAAITYAVGRVIGVNVAG